MENRFRRQHEQLRQVIVRVLRPVQTTKKRGGTPLEETAPKIEPVVDEAADANAIEVSEDYTQKDEYCHCKQMLVLLFPLAAICRSVEKCKP